MAVSTPQEFLAVLEKSRLLTAEQLAAARQHAEQAGGNIRPVVESLMQRGTLTRWQANQLLAGQSSFFLGKYKLLERIGAGGMGTVFKAEHVNMGRVVALKLISAELMNKPESVARFRREVHMAAALQHHNIVTAYDADQVGKHHFLVMEYVEGNSLHDWIKQHGRLPIDWSCECIRQAAIGLEYAHRKGVVHRDIKPNNLLVMATGTTGIPVLKILDMGLARSSADEHAEELTHSDQVLGTPDYMSPEQAEDSRTADLRSDIFSLGCTLFKLLTGQAPFGGRSAMEKLTARLRNDAPRVSTLRPDVPPGLDEAIARMLARDPAERFQNCQEVARAVEPYASGTAGASEESSSIMLCRETRSWSPSQAHTDSALKEFLGALSNAPDQNTPAMGHSRTTLEPRATQTVSGKSSPIVTGKTLPSRRKKSDGTKIAVLASSATVGCLLALAVVWAVWPRPAVLTIDWQPAERRGATLAINGQEQVLSATGPVKYELQPGTYRLFLARRGYEPISEEKNVARGDQWAVAPKWRKVELALPTFQGQAETIPADLARINADWVSLQSKRQQELASKASQRSSELEKLKAEFDSAGSATAEQAAALRAKVADFRRRWWGAEEAAQAAALNSRLPAAADQLDRGKIPEHELAVAGGGNSQDAPATLAYVLGDSRLNHPSRTYSVSFDPQGNLVVVGTEKGGIFLWDSRTGKLVREFTGGHNNWVRGLAFTPDGKTLASGGEEGHVQLWEVATGEQGYRMNGHQGRIRAVAFNHNGKLLASGGADKTVRVWDVLQGRLLHTLAGHTEEVISVAFHPQEDLLASGGADDKTHIWDAASGSKLHELGRHTNNVNRVLFTPDGQRLISGSSDGVIRFWEARSGNELFSLNWTSGSIDTLSLNSSGDRLVAGNSSNVVVRETADGNVLQRVVVQGGNHVAVNPEGTQLALTSYDTLRLFDVGKGSDVLPLPTHFDTPRSTAFSPDGTTLYSVSPDRTIQAWDLSTGEHRYSQPALSAEAVAVSPNGQLVAVACSSDTVVRVLDASTGLERMALSGHTIGNYAVAFSPDGKQLASGGQDQIIRLWNLESRTQTAQLQGPLAHITALAYSPDGKLFAGYKSKDIYAWDTVTHRPLVSLVGHTEGISCLALHPSGQYLATGSYDDTVRVWDLRTAQTVHTLETPNSNVHDVAFSTDGQSLLATSSDWAIRFWDVHTGQQQRQWRMADTQPFRISISPDGRYLATGLRNGTIQLLRIEDR